MISVIIPVYNTADYLDECIQSVVSQTYQDLEILLIDDCSTDGSSQKLDQWGAKDERIRVVHKEINSGVSASRNIGLQMARGEYIAFVDSDDYIDKTMYEKMHFHLKQSKADIAICGRVHFTPETKHMFPVGYETGSVLERNKALEHCVPPVGKKGGNTFVWTKLFSREMIFRDQESGFIHFDESLRYSEDTLWVIQVMLNCNQVVFVNECFYFRRMERSGTSKEIIRNGALDPVIAWEEVQRFFEESNMDSLANNAHQRVVNYKMSGMRAALKTDKADLFKICSDRFLDELKTCFKKHPSIYTVKWFVRHFVRYSYFHSKAGKQF